VIAVDGIGQAVMPEGLKPPLKIKQSEDNFRLYLDEVP
jgi:hypothetical protein